MAPSPPPDPGAWSHAAETSRIVSVFGSNARLGYWEPPEQLDAFALFGNVRLDFREANLYEGITRVSCIAVFGGVDILVPEELDLDVNGVGLFGSFEHRPLQRRQRPSRRQRPRRRRVELPDDPDAEPALLQVRGFALFGSVTVQVRS